MRSGTDGTPRVFVASFDETKPTEMRVDAFCGACGAPLGRFDARCEECGERAAKEHVWKGERCE